MDSNKVIYKAINRINGKVYIGKTINGLERRISAHLRKKNGSYFSSALRKYGIQNFEFAIIDTAESNDVLLEKEIYWIKQFNSMTPNGYNLTQGGQGSNGWVISDESKKKMSISKKGKSLSEEHKRKISKAGKGRIFSAEHRIRLGEANRRRISKPISEETRKKLSAAHKGKKWTDEHKKKMSDLFKGRVVSEETRERMVEGWKKRRLNVRTS